MMRQSFKKKISNLHINYFGIRKWEICLQRSRRGNSHLFQRKIKHIIEGFGGVRGRCDELSKPFSIFIVGCLLVNCTEDRKKFFLGETSNGGFISCVM